MKYCDKTRNRICSICKKSFLSSKDLAVHLKFHARCRPSNYQCELCEKAFYHSHSLKSHMNSHKSFSIPMVSIMDLDQKQNSEKEKPAGEQKYRCSVCRIVCHSALTLQDHKKIHAEKRSFQCLICKRTYVHRTSLARHKKNCRKCKAGTRDRKSLQYVTTRVKKESYVCLVCSKVFLKKSALICHKRVHMEDTPSGCLICSKVFQSISSLKRHITVIHSKKELVEYLVQPALTSAHTDLAEKKVEAKSRCGVRSKWCYNLEQHMQTHTDKTSNECPHCSKTFSLLWILKRHIKVVHAKKKELHKYSINQVSPKKQTHKLDQFKAQCGQCPTCDAVYKRPDFFKRHVRKCRATAVQLQQPMPRRKATLACLDKTRNHEVEAQRKQCPNCEREYQRKDFFQQHMMKCHPRQKKLQYPMAIKKAAKVRSDKVANSVRSYCCPVCKKVFTCSRMLEKHSIEHEDSEFTCSICYKLFTRSSSLSNHMQSFHADKKIKKKVVKASPRAPKIKQEQDSERIFEQLKYHGEIIELDEMF